VGEIDIVHLCVASLLGVRGVSILPQKLFIFPCMESFMKFLKVAAIIALAALPLLLASRKEKGLRPISGDLDNIFEQELTVD
jgi:hypothetical protein